MATSHLKVTVDLSELADKLRDAADALDGRTPPPTSGVDLDALTEDAENRRDDDVLALIAEVRSWRFHHGTI